MNRPPFLPKVVKNDAEHRAMLARVEMLFDARPDTPEGDELKLLLLIVERYEEKAFPIDLPDAVAAIRFRMEQQGLAPKDLEACLGGKSRVSEVLNGRRPLSLAMIRRLVAQFDIPPAALLKTPGGASPHHPPRK